MSDRSQYTTWDSIRHLWVTLGLPQEALHSLYLKGGDDVAAPSSFKVGHLAQSSIALSGLLAALVHAKRQQTRIPDVVIDRQHAVIEFQSEKLYLLNGERSAPSAAIGGLHKTADGHVRVHDSFPNHRNAALQLLGCSPDATRAEFAAKLRTRNALDLETAAVDASAVIFAIRRYDEWDGTPQAQAVQDFPITISKVANSEPHRFTQGPDNARGCLSGLRVLEMSRVIAAPVAGKTLAAHGADVLWITSPNLPDLPDLDNDLGRGKRTAQLDLNKPEDKERLMALLADADVFLQSYRPGSLADKGLVTEQLVQERGAEGKPLICASLSAWGTEGPWANRRGFDSIVQTTSGMNVSEAEHHGSGEAARPMPCQALDHGAGYFLASGIMAALYRQLTEGGSYQVDVSLVGVMKYLRSLGQYDGDTGFQCKGYERFEDVPAQMTETRNCAFGELESIKHSVKIEGVDAGWEHMPKPLGSDEAVWLPR
ncbi:hypothetical protein PMZ80_007461 [Knufia obscura]|uniref:CoA-transferase family III n=2 Tax=Knufia TaxID=430999 RepID=A0AAN8I4V7_9EURO|nr:hypothetical protein PMZ80_007461 [Knufia obscura]KAK5950450.1 hypothetical protein OHC33_008393 [Knufia fluminis]